MHGVPERSMGRKRRSINESISIDEVTTDYDVTSTNESIISEVDIDVQKSAQIEKGKSRKRKVIKSVVGSLIFTVVDKMSEAKAIERSMETALQKQVVQSKFHQKTLERLQNLQKDSGKTKC